MPCAALATRTGRILSDYGDRPCRTHPELRCYHAGLDLAGRAWDPVYAVDAGVVETLGFDRDRGHAFSGYGNCAVVRHDHLGPLWSFYAHQSGLVVTPGQHVARGEKLGYVGATSNGRFAGMISHLHLELRHASVHGASPFPGPYGRYNLDPVAWYLTRGVRRQGMILVPDPSLPCMEEAWERTVKLSVPEGTGYAPPESYVARPGLASAIGLAFILGARALGRTEVG